MKTISATQLGHAGAGIAEEIGDDTLDYLKEKYGITEID